MLLKKMQFNCLKRVHQLFTWKKIAESLSNVYEEVLKEVQKQKQPAAPIYQLQQAKTAFKKIR